MTVTEETTRFVFRDYTDAELSTLRRLISADGNPFLYEDKDYVACPIGVENYIKRKFPHATYETKGAWAAAPMKFIPEKTPNPRNRLQRDALKFLRQYKDRPQLGLITNTGSGKAQPYYVRVPTPSGLKAFGDLKVGDKVFGRDGKPTEILDIFEQGEQDVYMIKFSDGRFAECTLDHLWDVHRSEDGINFHKYTMKTSTILSKYKTLDLRIDVNCPVHYKRREAPKIDPLSYGMIASTVSRDLKTGDLYLVGLPEMYADVIRMQVPIYLNKVGSAKYLITSDGEHPLKEEDAPEIFQLIQGAIRKIDASYMYGSQSTREQVLAGITNIIGSPECHNGKYHIKYKASNERNTPGHHILTDMLTLVWSLGYVGSRIAPNMAVVYQPDGENDPNNMLRIVEVVKTGRRSPCRCIMVDNPEHLYLTEDFIVTHNTYMAIKHAIAMAEKTLIVCPSTAILEQWIDTLRKMFNVPANRILHVSSTDKLKQMTGDYDWVLVLEQTLQTLVRVKSLEPLLAKCKFGLKIIDEIHMFLRNNIAIDCCSNIKRSLYLTGTFYRTQEEESNLFQAVYHGILRFECVDQEDIEAYGQPKHINLYSVVIDSKLTRGEVNRIVIHAKISRRKMASVVSVGRYMDVVCPSDGRVTEYMKQSLEAIRRMRNRVPYGRMLILVPSIYATKRFRELLAGMFPKLKVGCINSTQPRSLNTRVKQEADIVVSTSKSSGVGFDMKDLSVLVAVEQFRSPVLVEQISGRLRPRPDKKDTYYVDIADKALGVYLLKWRTERLQRLKVKAKSYHQFKL